MKHKIQVKLRLRSEKILHGLVLGTVIFSVALMSVGTIQIIQAGLTDDTNVAQNVSAGALSIDQAPDQLNFNAGAPGDSTTANTGSGTNGVVTNDTTGAKAGWAVTGFFNTNFKNTDGSVQMSINDGGTLRLGWFPGLAVITPITGDSGGAVAGANNNFTGIAAANSLGLINSNQASDNNGAGAYNMTNIIFNFNIPISAQAIDYTTNLRLTIA
ncbi:TPA: hypothetical protein DCR79_00020 [Patescibacteria group bacterium]|uniref:WxL domain-containing protein n=1 Tax=candidate division Kazan bacterium GW2011_GWB1_45_10 TaxID=1620411 RepID=A0A0G1NSL1_UNCK3|nr:MAG: hypothetical protein VE97_C0004G0003 [candidate division Kazan bacterium GW2011_GWB1_45_10]HAR54667.1 hypothetical protein [Patescibacteria group bacterium]HCR42304.1 hypothetical protein [Patescibacteria group bacterium]